MCTFCSDMPSNEYGARKKAPITLFLKPNDPNNKSEKYRFRILNFRSPTKNDRSFPFISRYVHTHWGVNENGFKVVDECVVCPSTPYIDSKNDPTLGYTDVYRELKLKDKKPTWDAICPICRRVAEAWNSWKSSGRTDRLALDRIGSMKKQFQGIVPVYVIKDPVNEKNNGRFKCIIFSRQEEYKQFIDIVSMERAKISANGGSYGWCNGDNAVDFYLRMDKVPVTWNAGKPNEKQGTERRITKMAFGTKPYTLEDVSKRPIVTKEAIDRFEFDEQYYIKNTRTELEEFYKKYYSLVSSGIPEDEDDVFSSSTATPVQKSEPDVKIPTNSATRTAAPNIDKLVTADEEDLPYGFDADKDMKDGGTPAGDADGDDKPSDVATPKQSVEELLAQLNFAND